MAGHHFIKTPALLTAVLVVISTTIALGLGEGVVRLLEVPPAVARIVLGDPESPLQVSENPLQGYELKAGFSDPARPGYHTNSHGLRGSERVTPKPRGVFRIGLIGDSVVEGLGLRDTHTIAAHLEDLLKGKGVEVINAGVRGYNTQAEVELLRSRVLPYEPDLVIVVFVRNDHHNLSRHTGVAWDYVRPRWAETLFIHSHLFRSVAFHLNWFRFREDLDPGYLDEKLGRAQGRDNVSAAFDKLARLSADHGFRTVVVVWPNFGRTIKDPRGLMEPGSDRMRVERLAARHEIPVFRLREPFARDYARRGDPGPTPRKLYTVDGMHPNREGARVAAAILQRLIEERGLLDRHAPSATVPLAFVDGGP